MNKDIILIIQSSDTLHQVKNELSSSFFSFLKFKTKSEVSRLSSMISSKIQSLSSDKWTVSYLIDLQQTFLLYKDKMSSYMLNKFYISDITDPEVNRSSTFADMYFYDSDKGNQIILSIVSDNIEFTIFDPRTGNTFSVSSRDYVQDSQKRIESVCKQRVIEVLTDYLNDIGGERIV